MRTYIEQINVVMFINVLRFKLSEGILTSARVFKETFHLNVVAMCILSITSNTNLLLPAKCKGSSFGLMCMHVFIKDKARW
jgi:hypothetical protein